MMVEVQVKNRTRWLDTKWDASKAVISCSWPWEPTLNNKNLCSLTMTTQASSFWMKLETSFQSNFFSFIENVIKEILSVTQPFLQLAIFFFSQQKHRIKGHWHLNLFVNLPKTSVNSIFSFILWKLLYVYGICLIHLCGFDYTWKAFLLLFTFYSLIPYILQSAIYSLKTYSVCPYPTSNPT